MSNVVPLRSASMTSMAAHAAAISQLGKLAAQSFDTLLLAEGPPQPDYVLLDLCANALFALKQGQIASQEAVQLVHTLAYKPRCPEYQEIRDRQHEWDLKARNGIREAGKIAATTPAGLYAKALLVKHSKSGAAGLGLSLAEDFLACEGLRASLWPAGGAS